MLKHQLGERVNGEVVTDRGMNPAQPARRGVTMPQRSEPSPHLGHDRATQKTSIQLRHHRTRLGLLQDVDDLLFRKLLPLQSVPTRR